MVYYPDFISLLVTDPWPFIFSLSKIICVFLLLVFFYFYFIRRKTKPGSPDFFEEREVYCIRIELFKNERINPSLVSLVISNIGNREVDLEAPVLIFWRWAAKRKFRILSVGFSDTYPIYLEIGKTSVLDIDLEQFYHKVPELRRSGKLSAELNEVSGHKFRSGKIRLRGW